MPDLHLCQVSRSGRSVGRLQADQLQLPAEGHRRPDPTVEEVHRKAAVGKAIGKATPGVRKRRICPDLKFHGHDLSCLNIVHVLGLKAGFHVLATLGSVESIQAHIVVLASLLRLTLHTRLNRQAPRLQGLAEVFGAVAVNGR